MTVGSMLELDPARECERDDLRLWAGVIVTGELSNDVPCESEFSILQATGSVTLRRIDGREIGYGEKAGGFRELDNTRRCTLGPPAVEGSTTVSCDLIFGSKVGP